MPLGCGGKSASGSTQGSKCRGPHHGNAFRSVANLGKVIVDGILTKWGFGVAMAVVTILAVVIVLVADGTLIAEDEHRCQ